MKFPAVEGAIDRNSGVSGTWQYASSEVQLSEVYLATEHDELRAPSPEITRLQR
jgi:hypothetical protein